ncbi:N amino acid transport system [Lecanosticta acicola]|uniref:N amino acid transport system n=1 Tax=Lecanosticta acicola TaxID=111012 RepID=A0AAI9E8Q1_9PEZI|nr:N amino acid transport system [Lecanosticta acicola]
MSAVDNYGAVRDSGYRDHSDRMSPTPEKASSDLATDSEKKYGEAYDLEAAPTVQVEKPDKFNSLGWIQLTVCLIVEAIALGSLSIPSAFAKVGMVAGVILSVGLGFIAIYTSYVVGQVKLKYDHVHHYADAVRLIWGWFGYELASVMFVLLLVLLVGSHVLTGTIAWVDIVKEPGVCALVFSVVSAIILFCLALPPTFHEFTWLGYVDFVSIILAIGITIIATGVEASQSAGGLSGVNWSVWPPEGVTLADGFLATTNIIFAYSFAVCQFSFMDEMHTKTDYVKSIWTLGLVEIFIYTLTGAIIYAFVGNDVSSPALLSSGATMSRVAFGIALPVIFISGSINGTVVARYLLDRAFKDNATIRYIQGVKGWSVWLSLIAVITIIAWIIAEAVPFFSALLGLISSLFISGFTFYFPALFWLMLIKEGKWYSSLHNIALTILNVVVLGIGIASLGLGTYASVKDITDQYASGSTRGAFSCGQSGYT